MWQITIRSIIVEAGVEETSQLQRKSVSMKGTTDIRVHLNDYGKTRNLEGSRGPQMRVVVNS
jgi:hypothetical protein